MTFHSLWLATLLSVGIAADANAAPISVFVDTTPLAGTSARLALDFVNGGLPSNTVAISAFALDGTLGTSSSSGGVTGTLPGNVTVSDSSFFNELSTSIVLGTFFSFTFTPSLNGGVTPDQFSVFLLDPTGATALFATSDPTGADALLAFDVSTPGVLSVFNALGGEVTVLTTTSADAVPEPATIWLSGVGLTLGGLLRQRRAASRLRDRPAA